MNGCCSPTVAQQDVPFSATEQAILQRHETIQNTNSCHTFDLMEEATHKAAPSAMMAKTILLERKKN